eukprot:TRINITY_DN34230_c0_g1_i1.p1 TRINITY_DN34230_c0_g1~~TRINITY_DN34230_c0_g1_i1.p1  ORF type:complete len:424 (+),score=54.88 TRINITY_DN34230_c0_g1_i1:23-1273(+)
MPNSDSSLGSEMPMLTCQSTRAGNSHDAVALLKKDCKNAQARKYYSTGVAILGILQLLVMFIEVFGTLKYPHWLTDTDGSRKDVKYHTMTMVQTFLVMLQMQFTIKWHMYSLRNLTYYDPLWANVPLLHSAQKHVLLFELLILSLHEPPFLVLIWRDSYKLQTLALFRVYTLFGLFKGWSNTFSQGARLACTIAKVKNNKSFHLKFWMEMNPVPFVVVTTVCGWFFLSMGMYVSEAGHINPNEAMWMVFMTMTTVGYGDITPETVLGKFVAVLATLFGWLVSALLISIVSKWFTMNPQQAKVVDFMTEARLTSKTDGLAALTIQTAWRYSASPSNVMRYQWKLIHACADFRASRRALAFFRTTLLQQGNEERLFSQVVALSEGQVEMRRQHAELLERQAAIEDVLRDISAKLDTKK